MTTATTNTTLSGHRPSLLSRIGAFFNAYVEAASRCDRIAALSALSDEQLAERGLAREDIVRHVFADRLYL